MKKKVKASLPAQVRMSLRKSTKSPSRGFASTDFGASLDRYADRRWNADLSRSMNKARIRAFTPSDASFSLHAVSVFSDSEIDVPSSFASSEPQGPAKQST